ncbi:undecaprenyl/decaprenyl-phosphate alpha-N-acetylglucosaminyl 1-phosphate transferase [bacterium]|nr:MAG: undecaprenyl/decaprenyl-phosphate alpha-N-acetylglucosaminyl 1-phosphate transferase [bacterium]
MMKETQNRIQDIHRGDIPRFGGVFLIVPFIVAMITWYFLGARDSRLLLLAFVSSIILVFGLIDDKYNLSAALQLYFQIFIASFVVVFGIAITHITNPFGGLFYLGIFSGIATVIWIVAIINVINWITGIDGLASFIGIISCGTLLALSLLPKVNQPFSAILAGIVLILLLAFLPFVFPTAKIFLGTSGSMFLGFIIATIAIISGGKIATVFLVLGIPILDAARVIILRIRAKKSIFKADRSHLHHRLLEIGYSQRSIVLLLSFFTIILGTFAVLAQSMGKFLLIISLPLTFLVILVYFSVE